MSSRTKASDIRAKSPAEQLKQVEELKKDLAQLRVAQVTNPTGPRMAKIRVVRKSIARVLTIWQLQRISKAKEEYKGKKWVPKQLRPKMTRALRRALPKALKEKKSLRELKRELNLPRRKYMLTAPQ